jgi:hypothetical protein
MAFRARRLAALGVLVLASHAPAAAASSQSASIDPSIQRPFSMTMRGSNATEAWVAMEADGAKTIDEGIVDLKTGCITETMPPFSGVARLATAYPDAFAKGNSADATKKADALMTDPAVKTDLVRFVTAGRRFGQRRLSPGTIGSDRIAFSADGKTIAVEVAEAVFRSRDGGQTYDRLDSNMNRYPQVTADGKWLMFERCSDASKRNQVCPDTSREVRVVSADDSTPARTVAIGTGLLRGLDPTGQKLLVVRYDMGSEVTGMHIDPATAAMTRTFGIPSTVVKKNRFHDIDPSPKGNFGVFDDNDVIPNNVLTVVSMTDGKVAQKFTVQREMGTHLDEETGRIQWQTFYDDHSWARRPGGAIQDLGMGDPLGWAPGGRALVFAAKYEKGARAKDAPATLASLACKLVRVTTIN